MAEWSEIVRPVAINQPWYVFFFLAFSMVVTFGVMNVVIAMIVEKVIEHARLSQLEEKRNEKIGKMALLKQLHKIIFDLDKDGDSFISLDELKEGMVGHSEFNKLLHQVELPVGCSPGEMLRMLDTDGDGILKQSEFFGSFYRLLESGPFQSTCLMQMGLNEVKAHLVDLKNMVDQQTASLQGQVKTVQTKVDDVKRELKTTILVQRTSVTREAIGTSPTTEPTTTERNGKTDDGVDFVPHCSTPMDICSVECLELVDFKNTLCVELGEALHKLIRDKLEKFMHKVEWSKSAASTANNEGTDGSEVYMNPYGSSRGMILHTPKPERRFENDQPVHCHGGSPTISPGTSLTPTPCDVPRVRPRGHSELDADSSNDSHSRLLAVLSECQIGTRL